MGRASRPGAGAGGGEGQAQAGGGPFRLGEDEVQVKGLGLGLRGLGGRGRGALGEEGPEAFLLPLGVGLEEGEPAGELVKAGLQVLQKPRHLLPAGAPLLP
ncbi:hypothetical protein TthSNM76_11890 [Thermus thermophilus]|nr:hypothetical protein TthSNM76_11890 [Thermus thermophilus]